MPGHNLIHHLLTGCKELYGKVAQHLVTYHTNQFIIFIEANWKAIASIANLSKYPIAAA